MGRTAVASRRLTRFEQLTPDQERVFRGEAGELILTGKLRSYTGDPELRPFFDDTLKRFEADVAHFHAAVALTDAFVLMCNHPVYDTPGSFAALRSQLRTGLLPFARSKGLHLEPLGQWPTDLAMQLIRWLRTESKKKDGERHAEITMRKRYGTFCALFAELGEYSKLKALLPALDSFPNNAFPGAHDDRVKTKSLGQSTLIGIMLAARADFLQVVHKFRYAQELFKGPEVPPDVSREGYGQFHALDSVLWYLRTKFPDKLPLYTSFKNSELEVDRALFDAIAKVHGGWRNVSEYFQPSTESCVAPMILMTIYGHFNTEPLRILRKQDVFTKTVLNSDRVEVRTMVKPGKERGAPYQRSFPIDDADPASPNSLLSFMIEWTQSIRGRAGKYAECIFIFATMENEVKAFYSSKHDGLRADSKWKLHMKDFCKRHKLPSFNLKELRQTALDYGMWIFGDDIRATAALKGGESEAVIQAHYKGDAARNRADAKLAELQANKERYVRTGGKVHHLGSRSKDLSAATPGCNCVDTYDSPIPGEVKGRQCGAFGRCPGCPLGSPEFSAYGLARLLQLREEVEKAKSYMPMERWVTCWKAVLDTLNDKWLPLFTEANLWEQVKRMTLPPIGAIE